MQMMRKVNLGGFQTMDFTSSEHTTPQECARDLVMQMQPLAQAYPAIKATVDEIKKAYMI